MSSVGDEVVSYWSYLSVLRKYMRKQKVDSEALPVTTQEFPDCLLTVNILINALAIFPAFQQVRILLVTYSAGNPFLASFSCCSESFLANCSFW